jgi:hypothetical protein
MKIMHHARQGKEREDAICTLKCLHCPKGGIPEWGPKRLPKLALYQTPLTPASCFIFIAYLKTYISLKLSLISPVKAKVTSARQKKKEKGGPSVNLKPQHDPIQT